jgi:hypothetical protein
MTIPGRGCGFRRRIASVTVNRALLGGCLICAIAGFVAGGVAGGVVRAAPQSRPGAGDAGAAVFLATPPHHHDHHGHHGHHGGHHGGFHGGHGGP